ncbi:Conserved hypothetical protein [Micromonospora lupini str. Lupac 08]|uniref:Uncharacterized protein n=1 Tax=Micromonospora lupini str. Lupac 08 TaxID=1150864 RepID=I0KYT9_9ACTN|nr:Conserved hypothetical protein [Micromonospora lupini str. Lupac 08]
MVARLGVIPRSRRRATAAATSAKMASATGAPGRSRAAPDVVWVSADSRVVVMKSLDAGAQAVDVRERLPDGSTIPVPPVAGGSMMPHRRGGRPAGDARRGSPATLVA